MTSPARQAEQRRTPAKGAQIVRLPDRSSPATARILVADDVPVNVRLLKSILNGAGYRDVRTTTDPAAVIPMFDEYQPDIVLLDLHMPSIDGLELVKALRERTMHELYLPIVIFTGDDSPQARRMTLDAGASDFVTKPYDVAEVLLRVRNLLETRSLHLRLAGENKTLEDRVQQRTNELLAARFEVLERLAVVTEMRDDDTGEHTRRVGRLAADVAQALGEPEEQTRVIARVAPLHDIGKIAIPDAVLKKPGRLTPDEFAVMKTHTTIGANILAGGEHSLMLAAERVALTHHERWDGSGYPHGLRDQEIPIEGRIVAVADFYDALTHDRVYRPAFPRSSAMNMLAAGAGKQFDPQVATALLDIVASDLA